ncbi:TetR family transcriptional regulator [Agreia pratensis]|uniref:Transcriptional regulator, TetR family n=1 Tax=Agreia pratensis TaxID=150121 RepID=A0A1X7KJQ8_9MICO|nr:TetR family transcriptional regulator [Agreia pratensis]MBF4634619.1 TetR family transcriptional regulator [Agreia pratensis]SMG41632.1 transcriptional regulator, TetR family [Agreia pratensis]
MPRMSAEERRVELVSAAFRVVAARGVGAASVRAICQEAGMSLASFHYVFESRDQLMAELVSVVVEAERRAMLPPLTPGETFRDTVRLGLERYLQHLRSDPQREKAMLELTQYALRSPSLEAVASRQYERYRALAEDALATAAERWNMTWTMPVDQIARILVVVTDGVTMSWLVTRDDAAAARALDFAADSVVSLAVAA